MRFDEADESERLPRTVISTLVLALLSRLKCAIQDGHHLNGHGDGDLFT